MSFFGLDAVLNQQSANEEFDLNDAEAYDNLANKLIEDNDDLNDETFGDVNISIMDKDFDFAGQTARVADTIDEEQFVYTHTNKHIPTASSVVGMNPSSDNFGGFHAPSKSVQARSFQPIPGLWDSSAQQTPGIQQQQPEAGKESKPHMMSVEEIEAQMFNANSQNQQQQQQPQQFGAPPPPGMFYNQFTGYPQQHPSQQGQPFPVIPPGFPVNNQFAPFTQDPSIHNTPVGFAPPPQQQHQDQFVATTQGPQTQQPATAGSHQGFANQPQAIQLAQSNADKPYNLNVTSNNNPVSLSQVMSEDMAKNSAENSRLLKKSRRIAQQYKYNNLMTSFDKTLITRIQLNRVVTEDPYNEDFYYLVSSQIQARANPQQPLNEFAKTYLFQRGKGTFYFGGGGRFRRGQDNNPLQRMHQQVQQAVAYAREHPQKEQIALEGSLGKISLGTAKKPRQSLVLKKLVARESSDESQADSTKSSTNTTSTTSTTPESLTMKATQSAIPVPTDSRSLLLLIEDIYSILLEVESIERSKSATSQQSYAVQPGNNGQETEQKENTAEVEEKPDTEDKEAKLQEQYQKLWSYLEAVALESEASKKPDSQPSTSEFGNPFIEILKHRKGKRLIPRIFRHLNSTQRLTILTSIVHHLDSLDVVKNGAYVDGEDLKPNVKESVDIFVQTVLPPLVHLISESEFGVVIGLLEILILSNNVVHVARTKIGLSILTVLISQAEFISQQEDKTASSVGSADASSAPAHKPVDPVELANWKATFNSLFSSLQNHLASLFPPRRVDDSYVWHFLASLALAASLDHQRVIVDEVREKIFGTMAEAKALPPEMGVQKIANLNLFLNVMGLSATTTEIGQM